MAVRPIDANELYRIEKLLDTDIVRQDKVALNLLEQVLYDIQHVPTLTPPNEPLTFEERREMGRKPVWLDDEKTFGILQFWDDNNVDAVFLDPSGCIRVKSVIGKKIYRRPPEGEEEENHVIEITENL